MIADLGCNCTCWYKLPSSWQVSNLTLHVKLGHTIVPLGGEKKNLPVISFSCHHVLKRRDNRQFQIYVSEPRIRLIQLIRFISYPSNSNPHFFLPHRLSIDPPPCWGEQGRSKGGGNFIAPEPNNLINIAPRAPFSFFSCHSLLPSVF